MHKQWCNTSACRSAAGVMVAVLAGFTSSLAMAQGTWPARPIRLVVPFAPGSSTDITVRRLEPHMSKTLGQALVVDNRAGAAGNIGVEAIAHAAPDGYTIGLSGMGPSVLTHVAGPKPPFAFKDLAYIAH